MFPIIINVPFNLASHINTEESTETSVNGKVVCQIVLITNGYRDIEIMCPKFHIRVVGLKTTRTKHQAHIPISTFIKVLVIIQANIVARQHVQPCGIVPFEIISRKTTTQDEFSTFHLCIHRSCPHHESCYQH